MNGLFVPGSLDSGMPSTTWTSVRTTRWFKSSKSGGQATFGGCWPHPRCLYGSHVRLVPGNNFDIGGATATFGEQTPSKGSGDVSASQDVWRKSTPHRNCQLQNSSLPVASLPNGQRCVHFWATLCPKRTVSMGAWLEQKHPGWSSSSSSFLSLQVLEDS